ncbi:hypothetical protein [Nostoc sp.]|uniref:hypothetical protein n=1 Tax=Nostoc sp. TaxID=1180 RepID=UPI003FA53703
MGLPAVPSGNAGTISIDTASLNVDNGAIIGVKADGVGLGGTLQVNANRVFLNHGSSLTATTTSGEGGNIVVNASNLLLLRQESSINATAGGSGSGGNLTIATPIIAGVENSDIVANAFRGQGGNIQISTQGIFGLEFRPQLTPRNDITASSQFGINGTVQVNTIGVDPNSGLVELPANVTNPSQQIVSGCSVNQGSRFVATGRGGVPQNPNQQVGSDVYDGLRLRTWSDIRDISAYRNTDTVTAQIPEFPEVLVQATGWRRNAQGKIELVADKSSAQMQQPSLTCAAVSN